MPKSVPFFSLFFYSFRFISRHFSPVCTQIPDYYKNGLNAQEKFNAYRAGRTQDQLQARLAQVQVSDGFRPYTKQEFSDYFVSAHAAVQRVEDDGRPVFMLLVTFLVCFFSCVFQMYVGFTKHSNGEPAFFAELCRWALARKNKLGRPLFTVQRKDAVSITRWEHLVELGFTVR
jgi:hypothetical protein